MFSLAWLSIVLLLYVAEQLNPGKGGGERQGERCIKMCEENNLEMYSGDPCCKFLHLLLSPWLA